jgi:Tol biopolymer transport system component
MSVRDPATRERLSSLVDHIPTQTDARLAELLVGERLRGSSQHSDRSSHRLVVVVFALALSFVALGVLIFVFNGGIGRPAASLSVPPESPTGTLIVSAGDRGSSVLYSYDLATGATTDIGTGRDAAVSPDGTKIAFRLGNANKPGGNDTQIGVMNIDGTNVQMLDVPPSIGGESGGGAGVPAWSPDGSHIAFATLLGIYVARPDGEDIHQVSHYPNTGLACYDLEPAWSPDSSKLVFAVRCDGGNQGIWSVNIDGTNRQQIAAPVDGGVIDYRFPSWSPDGASLVFEGVAKEPKPEGYSYDVYVMDAGGAVTQITSPSPCERPVWSPDGSWIACTTGQIGFVRADGSDASTLTPFPGRFVGSVVWIPD